MGMAAPSAIVRSSVYGIIAIALQNGQSLGQPADTALHTGHGEIGFEAFHQENENSGDGNDYWRIADPNLMPDQIDHTRHEAKHKNGASDRKPEDRLPNVKVITPKQH